MVLLVALLLVGASVWAYRTLEGPDGRLADTPAPDASPTSVAVLPFATVGGRTEEEYFSQGLSDEIRAALTRVPGLEVASRTSSHALAGSGRSAGEIAGELGVATLLEGTVQRAEDRVRVTVALVDAGSDTQLWSETFDRSLDLESLFEVEVEIARAVAEALKGELAGDAVFARTAPTSLEAHDLYLLGLYQWNRRTGPAMVRAAELFRAAASLDPGYAPAFAGLANATLLLPLYAGVPAQRAMPEARGAARAALALDSTLAEAHAALGLVQTAYDWDWAGAEASFRRALELNPRYATAYQWHGLMLDAVGRHEDAGVHHERALALDPLSVIINVSYGNHLIFTGRYDEAIDQLRATLELQLDLPLALQFLAEAYLLAGRSADAEATLRRWARAMEVAEEPWARVARGVAAARGSGPGSDAVRAVGELTEAGLLSPYWRAQLLALAGAEEEMAAALRQGLEERDFLMFFVPADPAFAPFGDGEAFRGVLSRMGVPAGSRGAGS